MRSALTTRRGTVGGAVALMLVSALALVPAAGRPAEAGTPAPTARDGAAMAEDPERGTVVLFGGRSRNENGLCSPSCVRLDDTWTWNGRGWREEEKEDPTDPTAWPSARERASMAYDVGRKRVVLFGGFGANGSLNDTWTWDGKTWTQHISPVSPPPRGDATMAWDGEQVVLFGGRATGGGGLDDTWLWDGTTWLPADPLSTRPPPRYDASMAWDGQQAVLFGGVSGGSLSSSLLLADTWTWKPDREPPWAKESSSTTPPARYRAVMSKQAGDGKLVLFGGDSGSEPLQDTWTWDGATKTWRQRKPSTSPPLVVESSMAYHAGTNTAVLFGGELPREFGGPPKFSGETWTWNGKSWRKR